jgi:hypothetical protein
LNEFQEKISATAKSPHALPGIADEQRAERYGFGPPAKRCLRGLVELVGAGAFKEARAGASDALAEN